MSAMTLPKKIEAWAYEEQCGSTNVGSGIIMMDDLGNPICRLTKGTVREKRIALLWQAAPRLLAWAREACETERAFHDRFADDKDHTPPSWLAELEAVVADAERGEIG